MMSLFDYTGHPDKDGRGEKVNAYSILRKQPYNKRYLKFNDTEVFLYSKEFLEEYDKVEKIFKLKNTN